MFRIMFLILSFFLLGFASSCTKESELLSETQEISKENAKEAPLIYFVKASTALSFEIHDFDPCTYLTTVSTVSYNQINWGSSGTQTATSIQAGGFNFTKGHFYRIIPINPGFSTANTKVLHVSFCNAASCNITNNFNYNVATNTWSLVNAGGAVASYSMNITVAASNLMC